METVVMFIGIGLSWVAFWFLVRWWGGEYRPSQARRPLALGVTAAALAVACLSYSGAKMRSPGGLSGGPNDATCGSGPRSYDC